jgi:dethiobiotin synthetase
VRLLRLLADSGLRAAGMKPVAAGTGSGPQGAYNDDALALMRASNVAVAYEQVNPCCLRAPTSPHLAARREGVRVTMDAILTAFSGIMPLSDVIIVEGAGGWLAPIGDPPLPGSAGPTMQDVAMTLKLPVLLVVGIRLGCISHALLTAEAIQRAGLSLAGWVPNFIDPDFGDRAEYVESLALRLPAPCLPPP